jgi:hypothetical protein
MTEFAAPHRNSVHDQTLVVAKVVSDSNAALPQPQLHSPFVCVGQITKRPPPNNAGAIFTITPTLFGEHFVVEVGRERSIQWEPNTNDLTTVSDLAKLRFTSSRATRRATLILCTMFFTALFSFRDC